MLFLKSYEKRNVGKDYSRVATSALRKTKTPGAAHERFKRAVDAIMLNNETVEQPEFRRYINPKAVTDLVGGRPSDAGDYIAIRKAEVDAHHTTYGITPAFNRGPIPIVQRIKVPEWPEGIAVEERVESVEDGAEEDTAAEA